MRSARRPSVPVGECLTGRLRRLFARPKHQLGPRTVRGQRAARKRGDRFNPLSPKGDKHIKGKTDTGSDARCARVPRDEAKAMDPADLWDLMNSRISTCELEVGIRADKLRPTLPLLRRALESARREGGLSGRDRALLERSEYALRSDGAFFEAVNGMLKVWAAAFRDIKAAVAACAYSPEVAEKLAFIDTAMAERTAALQRASRAAVDLRDRVRSALDLGRPRVRRSLAAELA